MSEYALYQGDAFITLGTLAEISKETGIAERMLKYYTVYPRKEEIQMVELS